MSTQTALTPQKQYDWKDSNMALFGSDVEKNVKKSSAETERDWQGAGQNIGLKIWRVEKFKVNELKEEDYGKFHDGDAYIVLNTFQEKDELKYDVHFWAGSECSQDEYGLAAYKSAELDTFLDDKPVQHREAQRAESNLFQSYFQNGITSMKGGVESGFKKVVKEGSLKQLYRLSNASGTMKFTLVKEGQISIEDFETKDAFIFDTGSEVFVWIGAACSRKEKRKGLAMGYAHNYLKETTHPLIPVTLLQEGQRSAAFEEALAA